MAATRFWKQQSDSRLVELSDLNTEAARQRSAPGLSFITGQSFESHP